MGLDQLFQLGTGQTTILEILKGFFNNDKIELKTELTQEQIAIILQCEWHNALNDPKNFHKRGMEILTDIIIKKLEELQVSKDRKSRIELEKILTSLLPKYIEGENSPYREGQKI